jgi:hypothetical protein
MRRILALLTLLVCLFALPLSATERGVKRVEIKTSSGETVGLYEESHALVIGVSEYTNGWPKLPGVRKDVKAVTAALESHRFNVEVVETQKTMMPLMMRSRLSSAGMAANRRTVFSSTSRDMATP